MIRFGWILVFIIQNFFAPSLQQSSFAPRLTVIKQWGGPTRAALIDGDDVLIAEGSALVQSNLGELQLVRRRIDYGQGAIVDMVRAPDAIFLLTTTHLLLLDPATLSAQQIIRGGGTRLSVSDEWVMVAARYQGARLYERTGDGTLIFRRSIGANDGVFDVAQDANGILVTAQADSGLVMHDSTGEAVSRLSGLVPTTVLETSDRWLYAAHQHYVEIIDTRNTFKPEVVGFYAPLRRFRGADWAKEGLVIADGVDGLKFYDAKFHYQNSERDKPALNVLWHEGYVYSTHSDSLRAYDGQRLPDFSIVGELPLWSPPTSLTVIESIDWLLVGLGAGGLAIVDISIPFSPVLKAALPFSGPVENAVVNPDDERLVYLALGDGRLVTVQLDFDNPDRSSILSDLEVAGQPASLAINPDQQQLALASGRAGIHYFELVAGRPELITTQPAESGGIRSVALAPTGYWLVIDGSRLLHTQVKGAVKIVDELVVEENGRLVSLPQGILVGNERNITLYGFGDGKPRPIQAYQSPADYSDMQSVSGMLLTTHETGLTVLDINNPTRPREIAYRTTDFLPERVVATDTGILLVNAQNGVYQLTPASFSQQAFYPAVDEEQGLVPLTQMTWGIVGKQWARFELDSALTASDQQAREGIGLSDGSVVLLDDYPYRINGDGEVVNTNRDITGVDLALGDGILWLLRHDGAIIGLDPFSLEINQPLRRLNIGGTQIAAVGSVLFIGTASGELLRLDGDDLTTVPDLEDTIYDIAIVDHYLLVSAGAGGVWWLDLDLNLLARHRTPAYAAHLSPDRQWLAVAAGQCGLNVLDARTRDLGLRDYAVLPDAITTDVKFLTNRQLLVVRDGVPAQIAFEPDGVPPQPAPPNGPIPGQRAMVVGGIDSLRWQPSPDDCETLSYEVTVNGQVVGTTTDALWQFDTPVQDDIVWSVKAINSFGESAQSATWEAFVVREGWMSQPLSFGARLTTSPTEGDFPWWIVGGAALLILVVGIILLGQLRRREG